MTAAAITGTWLDELPEELLEAIHRTAHRDAYDAVVKDLDELVDWSYYEEFGLSELLVTARTRRGPIQPRRVPGRPQALSVTYGEDAPSRLLACWNFTHMMFDGTRDATTTFLP